MSASPAVQKMLGKIVLVRDNRAGVHVGTLEEYDPATRVAAMTNARKVWYWVGAAACHGVAARGLNQTESKVCPVVDLVISSDVVETVLCTPKGAKSVMEAPEWIPDNAPS